MKPMQSSAPSRQGAHPHKIDESEVLLLKQAAEKLVRFGAASRRNIRGDDLVAQLRNQHPRSAPLPCSEELRGGLDGLRDLMIVRCPYRVICRHTY